MLDGKDGNCQAVSEVTYPMQQPKTNWTKPWWKPVLIGACVVLGLAQVIGSIVVYFAYR
ncbi:hypothetical protein [Ensifer adhaerens]|uniref:hypothetical protein n=1 Tax=Ensifer adhaerens TaxID=106592 RepID=UPI000AF27700|nr:hypothetical protein [Ensifer adhaerens]